MGLRDGEVFGVITFRRHGAPEGTRVIAELEARNPRARFVYISSHQQATAESIANVMGISTVLGDLDPEAKARAIRDLGGRTMWIGDGTSLTQFPASRPVPSASPSLEFRRPPSTVRISSSCSPGASSMWLISSASLAVSWLTSAVSNQD